MSIISRYTCLAPKCLLATAAQRRENSSTRTQAIRRPRHLWHTHGPNFTPCFSDPSRCSTTNSQHCRLCPTSRYASSKVFPHYIHWIPDYTPSNSSPTDLILDKISQQNICIPLLQHLHFQNLLHEPPEVGFVEAQTHTKFAVTIHRQQT